MPHYADGTEAKVGDQVTGKLFNSEGIKAGTIISITPGAESCNALVQFTEALLYGSEDKLPRMAVKVPARLLPVVGEPVTDPLPTLEVLVREVAGSNHGTAGSTYQLVTCADYCDTNKLTKVG